MSRVTCAISGLKFTVSYFDSLTVSHTEGYVHPIFAVKRDKLYTYYKEYYMGRLSANDSYLLFLAFLHSSERITWSCPASCKPLDSSTRLLVDANLTQLVEVIEKTDCIQHPHFEQPDFRVHKDNCSLSQVPNWIAACEYNVSLWYSRKASREDVEALQRLENKLTTHIYSSEPPEKYARAIAEWAAKAGEFPPHLEKIWKETIRACFSSTKMFNTPLVLLKEIKEHIECNIPAGSIHFSAISDVIKEGIAKHEDYLGGSSLALGYTLLPTLDAMGEVQVTKSELKGSAEIATIAAKAGARLPIRAEYPDAVSFIKAKLAYRVASTIRREKAKLAASIAELKITSAAPVSTPVSTSVALVDCDIALPENYTEPNELLDKEDIADSYSLDECDLDGLTIKDSSEELDYD